MRRLPAILLVVCFAALGTRTLEYLHNLQHDREDAAAALTAGGMAAGAGASVPDQPRAPHDESNCEFHAQLHIPMMAAAWLPILVLLGLFVAFLTLLSPTLVAQRVPLRIACRGPPTR